VNDDNKLKQRQISARDSLKQSVIDNSIANATVRVFVPNEEIFSI